MPVSEPQSAAANPAPAIAGPITGQIAGPSGPFLRQLLLSKLDACGVAYGSELSVKLAPGRLIADRLLVGVRRSKLEHEVLAALTGCLNMPEQARVMLEPFQAQASAWFFGIEDRPDGCVCKVYLEFWDTVAEHVQRTGSAQPQLLHLGVKWHSAVPGRVELARYTCWPLLSARDILRRMAACYPASHDPAGLRAAQGIVRQAMKRRPDAPMVYLEAAEDGNSRCSFDINVYRSGLRVQDALPWLQQAGLAYQIAPEELALGLSPLLTATLGHVSGGIDRHGAEFFSVYAEQAAMPLDDHQGQTSQANA